MGYLPRNTVLGHLELVEVFAYYDIPILFVCRNSVGTMYLVVQEDEDDEQTVWLYVAISQVRYQHIRSGGIDLNQAYRLAEDEIIFEVEINSSTDAVSIHLLESKSISDERLPAIGETIHIPTQTLAPARKNLAQQASQTQREIINLELFYPNQTRTEAPARELGEILMSFQDAITALGQQISPQHRQSRKQTQAVVTETQLVVTGVSAASFNVELASSETVNLFQESLVADAVEELLLLLRAGDDANILKDRLSQFTVRVSSGYLNLLTSLSRSTADTAQIIWNSPNPNRGGNQNIAKSMLFGAIEILRNWEDLETENLRVIGRLIGLNIRTRVYEITSGQANYKGDFHPDITVEAFDFISHCTINQSYIAQIRQVIRTKLATGEQTTYHYLLSLEAANDT